MDLAAGPDSQQVGVCLLCRQHCPSELDRLCSPMGAGALFLAECDVIQNGGRRKLPVLLLSSAD